MSPPSKTKLVFSLHFQILPTEISCLPSWFLRWRHSAYPFRLDRRKKEKWTALALLPGMSSSLQLSIVLGTNRSDYVCSVSKCLHRTTMHRLSSEQQQMPCSTRLPRSPLHHSQYLTGWQKLNKSLKTFFKGQQKNKRLQKNLFVPRLTAPTIVLINVRH